MARTAMQLSSGSGAIRALSMDGPHDALQHVDRGRRPLRAWYARRNDFRLSERAGPTRRKGRAFDQAIEAWSALASDPGATFDREVTLDASGHRAYGHLGHDTGRCTADRRICTRSGARDESGARP
jgi:hypothetical protein